MLAFLYSSITLEPGTSTANGVDDNTSKFPPCVQASALKQMCTADLGSISQGTGHECTCSLFSIKGQPNSEREATFQCLRVSVCQCEKKKKKKKVSLKCERVRQELRPCIICHCLSSAGLQGAGDYPSELWVYLGRISSSS